MLFALCILFLMLPFIPFLFRSLSESEDHYQELATRQFFFFTADEIFQANRIAIQNDELVLHHAGSETVHISQYGNVVRRQVLGKGHEILLRDVADFQVAKLAHGISVSITTTEGETYEKAFSCYE